jgi:surface carbohydrate biosynthesis protein
LAQRPTSTAVVSDRRWLLLVVETKARELHAKMLLGLIAAERGWGVIIGNKTALRVQQSRLPRGTFLEKGVAPATSVNLERARATGNRVSALCEEGLLYLNREDYKQRRLEARSIDTLDYFFAWGDRQANDVMSIVERGPAKVVISGNPRFDLLRPQWRGIFGNAAAAIRERYGPTILVNTKFALVNNIVRDITDYTDHLKAAGKINSAELESLWRRYARVQERVFPRFLDLLPILSREFPDHTIVVRPHPSENDEPWVRAAKSLSNVEAIYGGNVHEWIMAADAVIQNNCTTGIEAFLLDKPSISYRPFKDDGVELELPEKVSFAAETESDVVAVLHAILAGRIDASAKNRQDRDYARQFIANIDGKLACDVILDTLERVGLPSSPGFFPIASDNIVQSVAGSLKRRFHVLKSLLDYNHKKFPGLHLPEMQQLLDEFRTVSGRFRDVNVVQAMDGGFCLYRT